MNFPNLCGSIEPSEITSRIACDIVYAALKDMGELNQRFTNWSIKVKRITNPVENQSCEEEKLQNNEILCIGFDGRKDKTLILNENNNGVREIKEEHYVLVTYPEKKYLDHVSPQSGKSVDVAKEILEVVHENLSHESLLAIVADGTPVNTGIHGGIIRLMEIDLKRQFVCIIWQK